MSRYERFVRTHLNDLYLRAHEALGNEDDAALAAQFLCLEAFRRMEAEEWGLS